MKQKYNTIIIVKSTAPNKFILFLTHSVSLCVMATVFFILFSFQLKNKNTMENYTHIHFC